MVRRVAQGMRVRKMARAVHCHPDMSDTQTEIVAWTVVDADARERFVTEDWQCNTPAARGHAQARRDRLATTYGKQYALEVWGIDRSGNLVEVEQ